MLHSLCDVHTHTLYSRHAYSTVEENLRAAAEKGLELLGMAEHFSSMLFPEPDVRNFQYFYNYAMLPDTWHGVRLMHGCEADIVDCGGNLYGHDIWYGRGMTGTPFGEPTSLKHLVFSRCDYVVASIHNPEFTWGQSLAATTRAYVGALEDPKVLILGHTGRAGVPFELDTVLTAARDLGKLIEINEHSLADKPESIEKCRQIAERCADLGVHISVSSDAHASFGVGGFDNALTMLEQIHFPQELIATSTAATFERAIRDARIPAAV